MPPSPTPLTTEQLLAIAKNYWRADKAYYNSEEASPEQQRIWKRWDEEIPKLGHWRAFLRSVNKELPGVMLSDITTGSVDPCFRCAAYLTKGLPLPNVRWVALGCISILAPIYSVYGIQFGYRGRQRSRGTVYFEPLPPEVAETASIIARRIEAEYGVWKLPRELADTPVPLIVEWQEPPDTTLFHAFFSSEPGNIP